VSIAPYKGGYILKGYPAGGPSAQMTYLVGPLDNNYKKSPYWQDWLKIKSQHKDLIDKLAEYSFKMHQADVMGSRGFMRMNGRSVVSATKFGNVSMGGGNLCGYTQPMGFTQSSMTVIVNQTN
jgi:hypothetical protein